MANNTNINFVIYFKDLKDPRIDRLKLYPMLEILFLVLCGTICGADSWRDFVSFGNQKIEFLRRFFPYKHGIPSKNTLQRLFAVLDTDMFRSCFINWMQAIYDNVNNEVIAIDGKTLRQSFDKTSGLSAIHMVSAFSATAKLVIGQIKVDSKSNEIPAIHELLQLLEIKGAIITMDAMGCQKKIVEKIVEKEADYIISLKGNQGNLHKDVKLFLNTEVDKNNSKKKSKINDVHIDIDKDHGRIETRKCYVSDDIEWLEQKNQWAGLKSIAIVEETREINGKVTKSKRYFISSLEPDAKKIAKSIRSHWGIENSLHYILDNSFDEDKSRVRKGNAAANLSITKHLSLNLLQKARVKIKSSIKGLRKKAGWSNEILHNILKNLF